MSDAIKPPVKSQRLSYTTLAKVLYYVYFFMDGYDEQTLSVCMRAFEVSLGLSPSSASVLATVELMALLGCCPFWGYMADKFDVKYVMGSAMFVSGISCIFLGCSSNYTLVIFSRFLHGFSLSCVAPAMQKIITDSTDETQHSTYFGICHSVLCLGRLISAVLTTYTSMIIILGTYGWRVSYCVIGSVWIAAAVLVIFFMKHTINENEENKSTGLSSSADNITILTALKATFKTKTSWILLLVTYVADAPFGAFVYMISFLQYTGLSDFMAGVACAASLIGGFLGGALGGLLIDACQRKSDKYGRLTAGTSIVIMRLFITLALFLGPMPKEGRLAWFHYVEFLLLGASLLTVSSVDRPIMAAVVAQEYQGSANAITRCFAGIPSSATFVPLCGFLAERAFGYIPTQESIEEMAEETKMTNATALSNAMMYIICIGTVISVLLYSAFFFTYPEDAAKNKRDKTNKESTVEHTVDAIA